MVGIPKNSSLNLPNNQPPITPETKPFQFLVLGIGRGTINLAPAEPTMTSDLGPQFGATIRRNGETSAFFFEKASY